MVNEIKNLQDFTQAVNDKVGLVVIDFYGDWCPPCKMIAPKFAKLAEKYPTVGFYKLNSDTPDVGKIVAACEVSALPTFCFFVNGKYITRVVGANDVQLENAIIEIIKNNNNENNVNIHDNQTI
ncbi:thioredoxin-like protein [Tupanvirus deep ocean]|uniref:Thioredoxin-like protein n=2 Tax=Tupanvirus TaxID=2094720 RepID=A0AC62A7E0_9VIRU|nr:thioredoxin-like protein [Tupanvirus deep ocean]QKU33689.1 thioredoxin-like protein [Tupanvirus deep ocean]